MDLKKPTGFKESSKFYEDEKDPTFVQIKQQLVQAYECVGDNIDWMIKSKGAKKTMEFLVPFFVLYAHFFGDDAIQIYVNKITRSIGKSEGMHELQMSIGKSDAFWEMIGSDPLGATTMYLSKLTDKILSCECSCGCLPCL